MTKFMQLTVDQLVNKSELTEPQFHCRVHNSPPRDTIVSLTNAVKTYA
jgi:hypothetical protein